MICSVFLVSDIWDSGILFCIFFFFFFWESGCWERIVVDSMCVCFLLIIILKVFYFMYRIFFPPILIFCLICFGFQGWQNFIDESVSLYVKWSLICAIICSFLCLLIIKNWRSVLCVRCSVFFSSCIFTFTFFLFLWYLGEGGEEGVRWVGLLIF